MIIATIADIHGYLPTIPKDSVDFVLIAGDICPDYDIDGQREWVQDEFQPWLNTIPPSIWTAGNHDFYFESIGGFHGYDYIPQENLTVYKFPYVNCQGWAFHKSEKEMELLLTDAKNFDILLCHGPPFGIGDTVDYPPGEHAGALAIRNLIDVVKPKICTYGHIHEARGLYKYNETMCINCSIKDRNYRLHDSYPVIDTKTLDIELFTF